MIFFTQNLGCCLIGQLHVYNFIRQVWLMLQNSYCCKFSWISDTNYLNFRHLWIRHRLLFYRHYYILYRHILFILCSSSRGGCCSMSACPCQRNWGGSWARPWQQRWTTNKSLSMKWPWPLTNWWQKQNQCVQICSPGLNVILYETTF